MEPQCLVTSQWSWERLLRSKILWPLWNLGAGQYFQTALGALAPRSHAPTRPHAPATTAPGLLGFFNCRVGSSESQKVSRQCEFSVFAI